MELLAGNADGDASLVANGIGPAAGEKAACHVVVDALVVACEAVGVRRRMDGRMCLIVVLAVTGPFKGAIEQALRNVAPRPIGGLLCDEAGKVKVLVVLVRLGSRIREEALLVVISSTHHQRQVE